MDRLDSLPRLGGKQLDPEAAAFTRYGTSNPLQLSAGRTSFDLVALGQEQEHREIRPTAPFEHLKIERRQRMANIHYQDQTRQ
jgi:hypothetical protein